MKTYPIFLASSYELRPEREKFEVFIGRQNKRLLKRNVQLRLEIWEDMGAELNNGRKQDDYNKALNKAEIVIVLFWAKMGKYTLEEFDLAYQRFKETGRPIIYVYEKQQEASHIAQEWEIKSKKDFLRQLLTPGNEQFHSIFQHHGELLFHFQQTLFDLFDNGTFQVGEPIKTLSRNAPHSPSYVIGREEELEKISEKLSSKGNVFLISGEGGMGKTTLAAKYWHENKYTYGHGVYLFCERGILNAMMDDGLGLELQGMEEDQKIRQIQRKLNSLGDDVLLLLDNANDAEDIRKFLRVFSGFNGNILITSREREVLVNGGDEFLLGHLDPKDAKALFESNYKETGPDYDLLLDSLLKAIHYHTLLVEVFSKNLREASELGESLKSFMGKLEEKALVLNKEDNFEVRTNYTDYVQKQVPTTNDILEILYDFSGLSEEERKLLVLVSLLPTESYTLPFLLEIFEPEKERAFRDTLKRLFRKGWIGGSNKESQPEYRLSPVIQNLVLIKNKETLWKDGKAWVEKLTDLINFEDDKDNAHTKFHWIPFCRQMIRILSDTETYEFSLFLNNFSILSLRVGSKENLEEAYQNLEKALASSIKNLGESSPLVARSRSNLAMVLQAFGGMVNLLNARTQLEMALAIDIRNFGENSPFVSTYRSNLAMVLKAIGGEANLLEAKEYLEMALAFDISNHGVDSSSVATYRSNLASALDDLGGEANLIEAREHLEMALASDIDKFSEYSPLVAIRRSNLAMIFQDLGGEDNLLKAKENLELALASEIRNFGENSPLIDTYRSNLATILADLGGDENLLKAIGQLEKALASGIHNFGEEHHNTFIQKFNLGTVLIDLGEKENLRKAINLFDQALEGYIKSFGKEYYMIPIILEVKDNAEKKLRGIEGD